MEQFSLEKWLQDKSRKVITRDGRPVRIVCWDAKMECPIIALALNKSNNKEISLHYRVDGTYSALMESDVDLFFADEEGLSEFEKQLGVYIYYPRLSSGFNGEERKYIRDAANTLLNLARKELEANYYTKVLDDRMVFKSELHATDLQTAYDMGKQDALKDLPKWKKAEKDEEFDCHVAIQQDDRVVLSDFVQKDEYYITLDVLKTLPKEE